MARDGRGETAGARPLIADAPTVAAMLDPPSLVEALADAFADPPIAPDRHHHEVAIPGDADPATLLLMPAWRPGGLLGVKVAAVIPGNPARGAAAVAGGYLLLDATTGAPLLLADAGALTRARTAAVSALAASRLARRDSRMLLMVGAGGLVPALVEAYAAVFALDRVLVWARRRTAADAVVARFAGGPLAVSTVADLEPATRAADIVSTATAATAPLVFGDWIAPGTHLDCVGAFTPAMREVDAAVLGRAAVYVDTRAALGEAGDLARPIADGGWAAARLVGDLGELVRGEVPGRRGADAVTLFKSIGTAAADLAAAMLLHRRLRERR